MPQPNYPCIAFTTKTLPLKPNRREQLNGLGIIVIPNGTNINKIIYYSKNKFRLIEYLYLNLVSTGNVTGRERYSLFPTHPYHNKIRIVSELSTFSDSLFCNVLF